MTDDPNAPNKNGETPILWAAINGHTEIVIILAPNAPGYTPIYWAESNGHTKIVKILVSLTDNPNSPIRWGNYSNS